MLIFLPGDNDLDRKKLVHSWKFKYSEHSLIKLWLLKLEFLAGENDLNFKQLVQSWKFKYSEHSLIKLWSLILNKIRIENSWLETINSNNQNILYYQWASLVFVQSNYFSIYWDEEQWTNFSQQDRVFNIWSRRDFMPYTCLTCQTRWPA